ncbi:MAG: hypothetical protein FKY71_19990 [Spiribacter salinus]|uniref:Uncharacterized protein n=1 Tax=Spiribacter salinus TaxID=1335746 RepID=A0A540V5S7_9GAMM|nr:MAG: hypothetical protein FKY71_19990 [Spiribacter salinus]
MPALIGEGLLSSAERVYQPLKAGFYGLHAILLCLVMMALLRIKTLEGLSAHQPGELGLLLGLDRVPEVKTLRRKLAELGEQQQAAKLAAALTERWARARTSPAEDVRAETPSMPTRLDGYLGPQRGSRALVLRHQPDQYPSAVDDRSGGHP